MNFYEYVVLFLAGVAFLVFIAYFITEQHRHSEKQARTVDSPAKQSSAASMFDMVPYVLNEMNKMGEEQVVVCKKLNLTDEQIQAILLPIRGRYEKLKMANDNKAIVMPLLNVGGKWVENIIKGFMR